MYELFDEYCWNKTWKRLTYDKHHIKGLKNIAHVNLDRAITPVPTHYHANIFEFHCLIKGKRISTVGDTDYTITGNELFLTFPYEMHSTGALPQNPLEFYSFQIDVSDPDHMLGLDKEYSNALTDSLKNLKERHLKMTNLDILLLKNCFSSITEEPMEFSQLAMQYLCLFLFRVAHMEPAAPGHQAQIPPQLQRTLDYINAHIKESISMKELAEISGYSLSRFNVIFKSTFGIPPAEFVTFQKIEYAKKILLESDLSITELAYELNFSSSNYFSSVFKKIAGCRPSEFRQKYRGKL